MEWRLSCSRALRRSSISETACIFLAEIGNTLGEIPLIDQRPNGSPFRWYLENERTLLGALSFLGVAVAWEIGSNFGWVNAFFFSSPTRIFAAAATEVQNARFWSDLRISGLEFGLGYFLAVLIAVPLGILTGWYRKVNYFLDPWLNFLNALPRVALMPLIVLWVGLGIWSKVVVVFLGVFFTLIISTIQGVRTTDSHFLEVAASFNASKRRLFLSVVLPATLPFILVGMRLGIGRALIGVVVGELYSANEGLGYMITVSSHTFQTSRLLFGVIMFTLMGVVGVELIRVIERRFERWRPRVGAR